MDHINQANSPDSVNEFEDTFGDGGKPKNNSQDNESENDFDNQFDSEFDDESDDDQSGAKIKSASADTGKKVRLNKLIADSGICSRRGADKIIEEGQVTVNGKKVYELGVKVNPEKDHIFVQGKPIRRKFDHLYIMFHKPKGVLTTMEDPLERTTIKEFLEEIPARVFPVGRLDWDSEGLLLLTNDGDYANRVTHPKEEVTKTYLVKVDGKPSQEQLNKLIAGVSIEGGKVSAKSIEKLKRGREQYDWLKIIITEGKNRQIRQMFEKIGFDVLKLQRVAIGRLRLGQLQRGELVYLNKIAAERVFMADAPDQVREKKSYKGRAKTMLNKKEFSKRPAGKKEFSRKPASKKGPFISRQKMD